MWLWKETLTFYERNWGGYPSHVSKLPESCASGNDSFRMRFFGVFFISGSFMKFRMRMLVESTWATDFFCRFQHRADSMLVTLHVLIRHMASMVMARRLGCP